MAASSGPGSALNLVLLGSPGVGKSALCECLGTGRFSAVDIELKPKPPIPYKRNVALEPSGDTSVHIWDPLSMGDFASANTSLTRHTRGFVIVFDLASDESFQSVSTWVKLAVRELKDQNRDAAGVFFAIVGNKMDQPSVVPDSAVDALRKQLEMTLCVSPVYYKVSALSGAGTGDMLFAMTTQMEQLQRQADGNILLCGINMFKRGAFNKGFRRRLFQFYSEGRVEYYKDPAGPPRGSFKLEGCRYLNKGECGAINWPADLNDMAPEHLFFGLSPAGSDRVFYICCYDDSLINASASFATLESVLRRFKVI